MSKKDRFVLILILSIVIIGALTAHVSAGDWLDGWNFRQIHNITGSSAGNQTNYQIGFNINFIGGDSNGENLLTKEHGDHDYDDLIFASYFPGVEPVIYDYYIGDGGSKVFVEIPLLTTGTNQIAIYYGNLTAGPFSSGDNTFPFFDDFSSTNTSKWTYSGDVFLLGGLCYVNRSGGVDSYILGKTNFGTNYTMRSRIETAHFQNTTYGEHLQFRGAAGGSQSFLIAFPSYTSATQALKFASRDTGGTYNYGGTIADSRNIEIVEFTKNGTTSGIWRDKLYNLTTISNLPTGDGPPAFFAQFADGALIKIDNIHIRKWVYPEPVHSTWYSEENSFVADYDYFPTSGDVPLTVTFTDTTTTLGTLIADSWNWSFGDGHYSTLQNPTHQYDTNGNFTCRLTVTNTTYTFPVWDIWVTDYIDQIVIVNSPGTPTPTATPTPGYTGTIPNKPEVTGTGTPKPTGNIQNWSWINTGALIGGISSDLIPELFSGIASFIPFLIIIIMFGILVIFVEGWIRGMR